MLKMSGCGADSGRRMVVLTDIKEDFPDWPDELSKSGLSIPPIATTPAGPARPAIALMGRVNVRSGELRSSRHHDGIDIEIELQARPTPFGRNTR